MADVKNCHLPCLRGQANQPAHLAGLPGGGSSVLAQALASAAGSTGKTRGKERKSWEKPGLLGGELGEIMVYPLVNL